MGAFISGTMSSFEKESYDWSPSPTSVSDVGDLIKKNNANISDIACFVTALTMCNRRRLNLMHTFNSSENKHLFQYGLKEMVNNNLEGLVQLVMPPKKIMNLATEYDRVFKYFSDNPTMTTESKTVENTKFDQEWFEMINVNNDSKDVVSIVVDTRYGVVHRLYKNNEQIKFAIGSTWTPFITTNKSELTFYPYDIIAIKQILNNKKCFQNIEYIEADNKSNESKISYVKLDICPGINYRVFRSINHIAETTITDDMKIDLTSNFNVCHLSSFLSVFLCLKKKRKTRKSTNYKKHSVLQTAILDNILFLPCCVFCFLFFVFCFAVCELQKESAMLHVYRKDEVLDHIGMGDAGDELACVGHSYCGNQSCAFGCIEPSCLNWIFNVLKPVLMIYVIRFIVNLFFHLFITINATVLIKSTFVRADGCSAKYSAPLVVGYCTGSFICGKLWTARHAVASFVTGDKVVTVTNGETTPANLKITRIPSHDDKDEKKDDNDENDDVDDNMELAVKSVIADVLNATMSDEDEPEPAGCDYKLKSIEILRGTGAIADIDDIQVITNNSKYIKFDDVWNNNNPFTYTPFFDKDTDTQYCLSDSAYTLNDEDVKSIKPCMDLNWMPEYTDLCNWFGLGCDRLRYVTCTTLKQQKFLEFSAFFWCA